MITFAREQAAQKISFTVDEDSSDKAAQNAVLSLRRMVRYGKMAQAALCSLRTRGYYDGLAPMVSHPYRESEYKWDRWGHKSCWRINRMAEVCIHRLPRKLAFSRADLAPLGELHVRVERNADRRLSLWLDGPMMRQTVSEIAKYEIVKSSWEVGVVRINKGYLSWTHGCNKTFRIYHGAGCAGAKKTIEEFARLVSTKLCTVTDEVIPVAKTLDLQAEAWKWLVADGVAKRLLEEVHQLVDVIKVMES